MVFDTLANAGGYQWATMQAEVARLSSCSQAWQDSRRAGDWLPQNPASVKMRSSPPFARWSPNSETHSDECVKATPGYWSRSAIVGSIRVARRAGR